MNLMHLRSTSTRCNIIRCKAIYDAVKDIFKAFEVSADDCYKYVMARSNDTDVWAVDNK